MSKDNTSNEDFSETTEKNIQIDRSLWDQLRAEAAREGVSDSEKLEAILTEYLNS